MDIAAGHRPVGTIAFSNSLRPPALTADGRFLFQHIDGLNGFEVADARTKRLLRRVEHSHSLGWFLLHDKLGWLSLDGLQRCHGLAITVDQTEVWSACGAGVTVHSARPPFPELARIPMRDDVYWLTFSPDGRHSFVAVRDRAEVAMVETATRRVVAHIPTGPAPKRNLVVELSP